METENQKGGGPILQTKFVSSEKISGQVRKFLEKSENFWKSQKILNLEFEYEKFLAGFFWCS